MEKAEYRAVIKFFVLEGLSATGIHKRLVDVLHESAPSFPTVHRWTLEFKRGRTSVADDPRGGRPKSAATPETIQKIQVMVSEDPKLKVREIADATKMSIGSVFSILHNNLGVKKLGARWVPCELTINQKRQRVSESKQCLAIFNKNPKDFVCRLVTCNEIWIHHYTMESVPKRPKIEQSTGKVLASVFWDYQGILLIDYLEQGKTITSEYYAGLLDILNEPINEKRLHIENKQILFLQENSQNSLKAVEKINDLHFELLPHSSYSPDLAPSDYYLFPNLKKWLAGKTFTSFEQVKLETNGYFEDLDKPYYKKGIEMLKDRWMKCIELKGDYVE